MFRRASSRVLVAGFASVVVLAGLVPSATAGAGHDFATPVFGLAARGNVLFAADAGAGVVRLGASAGGGRLVAELPGVTDVAPLRRGRMWALTSAPRDRMLYRIVRRNVRPIANVGAFERRENPDGGIIESNPFDLATLGGGQVLIADAAANALLISDRRGNLDWVATFPDEVVSTQDLKDLVGCPGAPPDLAEFCDLPPEMPAQAVPTSVAVGPDGAYYVTELKGFPAPQGESRIWRVEPGTRHTECDPAATGSPCTVVADGFTSMVDITFGPDGTAYVVELDEASWFAVELPPGATAGGTVNECGTTWTCVERATDLQIVMAAAVNDSGDLFAVVFALVPGEAQVVELA